MELKKISEKYKGKHNLLKYAMPLDSINPEKKKEECYYRGVLEHLFCLGVNGETYVGISGLNNFNNGSCGGIFGGKYEELRQYAKGKIPIEKYKSHILGKDSKGKQRDKSFINISWRIDTGYLKTLDQMKGQYDKVDYEIEVSAIDPASQHERKLEVAGMKIWQNEPFNKFLNSIGIVLENKNKEITNEEDVNFYVRSGGLKLSSEISFKKAIDVSMQESKWRVLKYMLMEDTINLGIVATKDYIDQLSKVPMVRYVDPDRLLIPCSKYNDFRDITLAGEIRVMTISDLRKESNLPEEKLMSIARTYGNNIGSQNFSYHNNFYNQNGYYHYDNIEVYVLDGSWLSYDIEKYTEKVIDKYGTLEYKKQDYDYELPYKEEKKGKKLHKKRIQYTYEAKLVLGTDVIFGYGKSYMQVRKEENGYYKSVLPYNICSVGTMSKLERMIADIDEINILTYKRRNAIASIPAPPSVIINKSALENVELDGQVKSPIDLMNLFLEKGVLLVDTEDANGNNIANIHSIVSPVATAMYEQFRTFSELIEEKRRNIQLTTGMNDLVDGSTDAERTLKIQGEAKLEAASNAMQPEYTFMRELIENTFSNIILRWQEVLRDGDVKLKYKPLNETDIEIIELSKDLSKLQLGLRVKVASTYAEKRELLAQISTYKVSRQQSGTGGITEDVYLMIRRIIMSGNMSLAEFMLGKALERQRKMDEQLAMQRQEQNGKIQQESAKVAEEEKRKTLLVETSTELIKQHHKFTLDATLMALEKDLEDGKIDEPVGNKFTEIKESTKPNLAEVEQSIMGILQQKQQEQGVTQGLEQLQQQVTA